jgi:predicted transcriptional regulator
MLDPKILKNELTKDPQGKGYHRYVSPASHALLVDLLNKRQPTHPKNLSRVEELYGPGNIATWEDVQGVHEHAQNLVF